MNEPTNEIDLIQIKKQLDKRKRRLDKREERLSIEERARCLDIEYTSQAYNAFYSTKIEKDRSLLTICVAGLGFLVYIIKEEQIGAALAVIFFTACISYLICIFILLKIFTLNGEYLINIVTDNKLTDHLEKNLSRYDLAANIIFSIAIISSVILGISVSNIIKLGNP